MKRKLSILMAACMTASLLPMNIQAAENFTVTPTDITADQVANAEGFGRITMNETAAGSDAQGAVITAKYHGLVNGQNIVFPYTKGSYAYYVKDDVISYIDSGESFTDSEDEIGSFGNWNAEYAIEHQPRYYDLNGNRLFERFTLPDVLPEWIELDEIEARGYTLSDRGSTVMNNGHAVVYLNYYPDMVGGNLIAFIDKTGKVTCIADAVDPNFNTPNGDECKGLGAFGDNGWVAFTEPGGDYDYDDEAQLMDSSHSFPAAAPEDSFWYEPSMKVVGYLDAYGQKVLDVSHMNLADAWPFAEGLSIVEARNGLKGAIDTNGNLVIPCLYQELLDLSDGVFCAQSINGKWGYLGKAGQTIIPFMYDNVYGWANGLGAVVLDGKCGLVDANNNIVLPLEYDDITSFTNGVCYAIKDRKLYVITR